MKNLEKQKKNRPGGMEILWMIVTALTLFAAVHKTILLGFGESYLFFIFTLVAFLMVLLRRYLRKKENQNQ